MVHNTSLTLFQSYDSCHDYYHHRDRNDQNMTVMMSVWHYSKPSHVSLLSFVLLPAGRPFTPYTQGDIPSPAWPPPNPPLFNKIIVLFTSMGISLRCGRSTVTFPAALNSAGLLCCWGTSLLQTSPLWDTFCWKSRAMNILSLQNRWKYSSVQDLPAVNFLESSKDVL